MPAEARPSAASRPRQSPTHTPIPTPTPTPNRRIAPTPASHPTTRCHHRSAAPVATRGTPAQGTRLAPVEPTAVTPRACSTGLKEPTTRAAAWSATPPPEPAAAVRITSGRSACALRAGAARTRQRCTGTRATPCPSGLARGPPGPTVSARPDSALAARRAASTPAATTRPPTIAAAAVRAAATPARPGRTPTATIHAGRCAALTGAPPGRTAAAPLAGTTGSSRAGTIAAIAALAGINSTTPLAAPPPISRAARAPLPRLTRRIPRRTGVFPTPPGATLCQDPRPRSAPTIARAPPIS